MQQYSSSHTITLALLRRKLSVSVVGVSRAAGRREAGLACHTETRQQTQKAFSQYTVVVIVIVIVMLMVMVMVMVKSFLGQGRKGPGAP